MTVDKVAVSAKTWKNSKGTADKSTLKVTLLGVNELGVNEKELASQTFTMTADLADYTIDVNKEAVKAVKFEATNRLYLKSLTLTSVVADPTLAELIEAGENGEVTIAGGGLQGVKAVTINGEEALIVKDTENAVKFFVAPQEGDKAMNINGRAQEGCAQNNWALGYVENAEQYVGKMLKSIDGELTVNSVGSASIANAVIEAGEVAEEYTPNVYCPVNFMGESSVAASTGSGNYFFVVPKANEFAHITWAVWNAIDGAFYVPAKVENTLVNNHGFAGGFAVDWSANGGAAHAA